jgi:hypothetical protein
MNRIEHRLKDTDPIPVRSFYMGEDSWCPCGAPIPPMMLHKYFTCRPCWVSAPDYWKILLMKPDLKDQDRQRARRAILNHAARRAK